MWIHVSTWNQCLEPEYIRSGSISGPVQSQLLPSAGLRVTTTHSYISWEVHARLRRRYHVAASSVWHRSINQASYFRRYVWNHEKCASTRQYTQIDGYFIHLGKKFTCLGRNVGYDVRCNNHRYGVRYGVGWHSPRQLTTPNHYFRHESRFAQDTKPFSKQRSHIFSLPVSWFIVTYSVRPQTLSFHFSLICDPLNWSWQQSHRFFFFHLIHCDKQFTHK